jgi:hypothetical protein
MKILGALSKKDHRESIDSSHQLAQIAMVRLIPRATTKPDQD